MGGRALTPRLAVACALLATGPVASAAAQAAVDPTTPVVATTPTSSERIGTSAQGRPIRARVIGDPAAAHKVLIVGCVHGNERAGMAVTRALRDAEPPVGTAWWVVDALNPDRCRGAVATRGNAHGVDLNRNAPFRWRPLDPRGGTYYAGARAQSEPEVRAIVRLVRRIRPAASVWFHQHARLVDLSTGNRDIIRAYASRVGLPARNYGTRPGSITTWQAHAQPKSTPFVVELPAGAMRPSAVSDHVAAITGL